MDELCVSVIIPTFNREKTIKDSIQSVLDQTFSNLEVIVVDDCSTDNTRYVVSQIKDPRVRYITLEKNMGACVARNRGVEQAKGELIAFQDSDDIWHNDKLEKQVSFLLNGGYEFITCAFNRISEKEVKTIGYREFSEDKVELWCRLINGNWVSTQTILCYKYCFESIAFDPDVKRFQDWDLALQVATRFRFGSMEDILVDVYDQKNSITRTNKSYQAMKYIVQKHHGDVDFSNDQMAAQYFKTLGDIERIEHPLKALKPYFQSLKYKFNYRLLPVIIMCLTGTIRIYDKKYK